MVKPSQLSRNDTTAHSWLSDWSRHLWAMPLLLSVAFTALVVVWAQDNDLLERETL